MTPEERAAEFAETERAVTGRAWKDCEVCGAVRIPADWNPPWCDGCGGPVVNCRTCATGRRWWLGIKPPYRCPNCGRDPLSPPASQPDAPRVVEG